MFFNKRISLIAIICFLFFILSFYLYVIKYPNTQFSSNTLKLIPSYIKNIPYSMKFYGKKHNISFFGNFDYEYLNVNNIKEKFNLDYYPEFYKVPVKSKYTGTNHSFYIDTFNKNIIFVSKNAEFFIKKIKQDNIEIIDTNFNKKINKSKQYNKILDTLIIDNKIYVSFIKNINDFNCYNTSIAVAEMDTKTLMFENFFTYKDCVSNKKIRQFRKKLNSIGDTRSIWPVKNNIPVVFNKSGGRMDINHKKNKLYLTIGTFGIRVLAQDKNSYFGKTIEIDMINNNHKIFTIGHRNAQGLTFNDKYNLLFSSEHGPKGGDEINILISDQNYGWPISSYGEYYDGNFREEAPLHKNHKKYNFVEPIIHFPPSTAVSQIQFLNDEKTLLVSSLKAKKLYIYDYDNMKQSINLKKEFYLGERIRDLLVKESKIYLSLENTGSILILNQDSFY